MLWEQHREEDGVLKVPTRRGDRGWFDYRVPDPYLYIHLCCLSQSDEDQARLDEVFPEHSNFGREADDWGSSKAGICPPKPWFLFTEGLNPDYPEEVIESTIRSVSSNLDRLGADDSDPVEGRPVLLEAGSFGEHAFTEARIEVEGGEDQRMDVGGKHLEVKLEPGARAVSTSVCGVSPTDHRIGPPPLNDATHFSHE